MSGPVAEDLRARLEAELGPVELREELPGGRELPLVAPEDEDRMVEALRFAATEKLAVIPAGLGSKAAWCHPAERADLILSTRRLRGVLEYEPGDGTLTARAGSTLRELADCVRAGGHHLSPDVPLPGRSTLGGVLAAGQSGFDRLRHGPAREQVLGMRVLLADGTRPRSGGNLVKNVTGYDLHRLWAGSHGTLCVILEASLRLAPLPERERAYEFAAADARKAFELAAGLAALPLRPTALFLRRAPSGSVPAWSVSVFLSGRAEPLDHEAALLEQALRGGQPLVGDVARDARERARDLERGGGRWCDLRLELAPRSVAAVGAAFERVERTLAAHGLESTACVHPALGTIDLRLDAEPTRETAVRLARELGRPDTRLRWRHAPAAWGPRADDLDRFGAPAPGLALMRRLQRAADPTGVLARGRFHGGL